MGRFSALQQRCVGESVCVWGVAGAGSGKIPPFERMLACCPLAVPSVLLHGAWLT